MFGMVEKRVRLPPELLLMIAKHLTDTDCLAISLSGAFEGFTSLYNSKRKPNNITIDYKYFFLSDPKCWNTFFNQHALSPSSITSFNANNCYWIPAERLCYAIVKMENLEELSIKETKVSLPHLARVFELCPKIIKFDFTCREIKWEEIQKVVVEQNHSIGTIIQGFKKLISLKVSTSILDARDYLNDPWVIIIRMLSWCRDCKELTVEITYSGDAFNRNKEGGAEYSWQDVPLSSFEEEIKQRVEEDFFPQLDWMFSLKKLMLIKLGDFNNYEDDFLRVQSLLLENLLNWLISKERPFDSLHHLWIQDFNSPHIFNSTLLLPRDARATIESYSVKAEYWDLFDGSPFEFDNIEYIGGVDVTDSRQVHHNLTKLKYVRGRPTSSTEDDVELAQQYQQTLVDFFQRNQEIEYLNLAFWESDYVPSLDLKLPKLKVLYFEQETINKEVVDAFVELYPHLEFVQLNNSHCKNNILDERACLSSIRFRNLTSLHLYGNFELHDGAFLLPLIKQCPKLQSLHMTGSLKSTSFLWNFGSFLSSAIKLRELRLEWNHKGNGFPVLLLLKSLLGCSLHLERLALINRCPETVPLWDHPPDTSNFLIEFASKMKRLVCCCLVIRRLDPNLIVEVRQRIMEEVTAKRRSLWFHLGRGIPCVSDPDVPSFHFHEMVDPEYYTPPPTF